MLNSPFPKYGLTKENIETALTLSSMVNIPFTIDSFVQSINNGQPFVYCKPNEPISSLLEDFAFYISKDIDKKAKQENPMRHGCVSTTGTRKEENNHHPLDLFKGVVIKNDSILFKAILYI